MIPEQERKKYSLGLVGKFKDVKYCIWDVDLTFYRVSPQMRREFENKIYEYISQRLEIPINEAKDSYKMEFGKRKSKTAAMEALGLGKYAIQEVIDSIEKSDYLKKDPQLIKLFKKLEGYKHVIVSNSIKTSVGETLEALGLDEGIFKAIITKEDVSSYKPGQEPFLKALDVLGAKAGESVSIGDVDSSDIVPAAEMGIKTIFVWGKSEHADASVPTIYDVEGLLT